MEQQMPDVTLAVDHVVEEQHPGSRLALAPGTTVRATLRSTGSRPPTSGEFDDVVRAEAV